MGSKKMLCACPSTTHMASEAHHRGSPAEAAVAWAERHAVKGNAEEILKALDDFGWHQRWMMFVGDVKGEILDTAVRNLVTEATQPLHLLELGAFIGYSAVRIARLLKDAPPGSSLTTVEGCPCNA